MQPIKVAQLLKRKAGEKERHVLDEKITDLDGLEGLSRSSMTGQLTILRLSHELNVQLENASMDAAFRCVKCLAECVKKIRIPFAEREFIVNLPPKDIMENEEVFFVDTKNQTIDVSEMVRQEILLHFPAKAVCCDGCKGLCLRCGTNLNVKDCDCPKNEPDAKDSAPAQPFRRLKDLLK